MVTEDKTSEVTLIEARATVNLSGLRAGETATVDPSQPYIAACLNGRYLIPLDEHPGE